MEEVKITLFQSLFGATSVPYIFPLKDVVARIQNGKSKDKLEIVRKQTTKEGYDREKHQLPVILFAGEFKQRNKKSLEHHSGLMVTDYDGIFSDEEFKRIFETLKHNPHTVLLFESPSCRSGVEKEKGKGLKCVVRIPKCDHILHERYHKAFNEEFKIDYFDKSNCDVSRACFESSDPNIYVNYKALEFKPVLRDDGFSKVERPALIPITEEMVIIEKIMAWDWQKGYREGERNNYIFDLAGAMCEYGVSESSATGYISNCVVNDGLGQYEITTTVNSAYNSRQFGSKYFENYEKIDKIKLDINKGKRFVVDHHEITEKIFHDIKESVENDDFWFYEEDSKGNLKVKVDPLKYKLFLESSGFKKYYPNNNENVISNWVYIRSNIVVETSTERIKDFILDYLLGSKKVDVWNYVVNYQNMFAENFLNLLGSIDLTILKDKSDTSYLAFKNGILEVKKGGTKLIGYIDVDAYVWESHIIQRDFKRIDNDDNDYKKFVYNISNGRPLAIECAIGYLLCNFKNKVNNKAIILNDEVITDNPEGGTGKGVLVQGLRQIRKVSILDGKTFDDKKSFPYQTVSPETSILVFDDVKKNFDFESKFSIVTEGLTLERKGKDAIKLPVEDSPKMVISTNYAIRGEGNSHDRRRHEIEISQYYGKHRTPFDDFGRQLFDDWDDAEWSRFDNYMVNCMIKYFENGLIGQESGNKEKRRFIATTSMEFYEWMEDMLNFPFNTRVLKKVAYDNFVDEYQDYKRLSRKRFHIWVEKYASYKGFEFKQGRDENIGGRYFLIKTGDDEEIKENDGGIPF